MNKYRPIKTFEVGEKITQVFLVASVEGRTTKANKPYARVVLKDKGGQITVNLWDFDPKDFSEFVAGVYAQMTIEIEDFKGSRQAKSRAAPMVVAQPEDPSDYESDLGLSPAQAEAFYATLMRYKNDVENIFIKTYLDVIFDNASTKDKFITAPASVTNRGAYRGGLVEHTCKVMHNARAIVNSQREAKDPAPIDYDIVIAGVLAHDLGKMFSYKVSATGVEFTRSGKLLEHLPMSYGFSVQSFIQAESVLRKAIPEEIKDHINHCILAHHGRLEYGSPVKPRSVEAQIIHVADMADSTASCFAELTRDGLDRVDDNKFVEGSWITSKTLYVGDKTSDEK
jgi:3'-5' exoribonuclease